MARESKQKKRRATSDLRALAAELQLESPVLQQRNHGELNRPDFDALASALLAFPSLTPEQNLRVQAASAIYQGVQARQLCFQSCLGHTHACIFQTLLSKHYILPAHAAS